MLIIKKDISILGKGRAQGLDEHSLTAGKNYLINFTKQYTKFCLCFYYNGANSYLFISDTEIHKLKAKDSEIIPNNFCLGDFSKDFSASNIKKLNLTVIFMMLVLNMMKLQLMIYWTLTSI